MKKRQIVISIIVLLLVLLGVTFAWFNMRDRSNISNIEVEIEGDGGYLLLSTDGTNYEPSLDYTSLLTSLALNDVSGDGYTLNKPLGGISDADGLLASNWEAATPNVDYIDIPIFVKTNVGNTLHLSMDKSYISPIDNVSNISPYGSFSRNYIAGATRVAIFEDVDSALSGKLFWVPNETYQLTKNAGVYTFDENGTPEVSYQYLKNVDGEYTVTDFTDWAPQTTSAITTANPVLINFDTEVKKVVVRVWLEGTDRESSIALSGGVFKVKLSLTVE